MDLDLPGHLVELLADLVADRLPGLEPLEQIVERGGLPGDALGVAAEAVVGVLDLALQLEVDPLLQRIAASLQGFGADPQALDQTGLGGQAIADRLLVGPHGAVEVLQGLLHAHGMVDRLLHQLFDHRIGGAFERFHTTLQLGQGRHVRAVPARV